MGKKSGRKPAPSIRGMMRGLKNRWGRFQCPRDGSICKSLEAWHWHRHKHHPTENISYIELDGDGDDSDDHHWESTGRRSPSSPLASHALTSATTAAASSAHHHHHRTSSSDHETPSPRLIPPEAFAPLRPKVAFPDDISDLTEPEIPVLLSEEVAIATESRDEIVILPPEVLRQEVMEGSSNEKASDSRVQDTIADFQSQKPSRESRSQQNSRPPPLRSSDSQSDAFPSARVLNSSIHLHSPLSVFRLVALFVMEELEDRQRQPTLEDILPRVESQFAGFGLRHEALLGLVTGTLVGAKDQWKRGYDSGWKDGVKEVLHAPLLRGLPPHSPDGERSPEPAHRKPPLLECAQTSWKSNQGQSDTWNMEERQMPSSKLENGARDSTDQLVTPGEQSLHYSSASHHHSNDSNNIDDISSWPLPE